MPPLRTTKTNQPDNADGGAQDSVNAFGVQPGPDAAIPPADADSAAISPKKNAPSAATKKTAGKTAQKKGDKIAVDKEYKIPKDLFSFIPRDSADLYKIVPLEKKDNVLYVGTVNENNLDARDALNFITTSQGMEYKMQQITEEQFSELVQQYEQASETMSDALSQLEDQYDVMIDTGSDKEDERSAEALIQEEAPIIKLLSTILGQAVEKGTSDVHIEAQDKKSVVRYRIDGVLVKQLEFIPRVHDSIVARIKIVSNLRLDERRRPQDGRFSSIIRNNRVDFRVATFPTPNGEKVVLRVLDTAKGLRSLGDLGLEENMYDKVLRAIKRPYGLILATGPTGAGKTTTLYALLNMLDRKSQNIVSLEDPVEYQLEGINQSNIRPEIGYSFATGLRSVLRGDPDQILVGEIRDKETAQLAIQAALTGHLVYSTLHTNTAIGAVSRLAHFGIEPFLLAPTLLLIVGQRMARRLDGEGKEMPVSGSMLTYLEDKFSDLPQLYRSQIPDFRAFKDVIPTEENPSGMKGRIGVFEVLEVNDEIRSIIMKQPDEREIYKAARKTGFITMGEDAITKGLRGLMPFSEVAKISNEDVLGEEEPEADNIPNAEKMPEIEKTKNMPTETEEHIKAPPGARNRSAPPAIKKAFSKERATDLF